MVEETQVPAVEPEREPDFEFLDPASVRLIRDGSGWLRLEIREDRCYLDVKAVRALPLSDPERYLGFLNAKDRVIGLVEDPSKLDPDTRRIAQEEVASRYFEPEITKIRDMKEEFGVVYCDVETNMGRRQFMVKGIRDAALDLGDGKVLIVDVDGNRFVVLDWPRLDPKSRRFLERVI